MNATGSVDSRHIRMDIYDKNKYNEILNSGTITIGGLLYDDDKYLRARKILICTKFNAVEHSRKVCRFNYERCRRCVDDRSNGDHKQCIIMCHHCGVQRMKKLQKMI